MNDTDYALLNFLVTSDRTEVKEWYKNSSDADLLRATFLLNLYKHYLEQVNILEKNDAEISKMSTLTQAQAVIASVQ